jgi:hypothetical protein
MRKAFDWKHFRISMLEAEAVPQSCIPQVRIGLSIFLYYMRSLLLVESFDLRLSNQYVLARVISSCFRFMKMCLCQVSLLSRCNPRYLTSSCWRSSTLFMWWGGAHVIVNVTWDWLGSICSFCEAIAGSLSMASTAVSAKFAVVNSTIGFRSFRLNFNLFVCESFNFVLLFCSLF